MVTSQQLSSVDSLEKVYESGNYKAGDLMNILKQLAIGQKDPQKSLDYCLKLIETAKKANSPYYLYSGYLAKGTALRLKSDLPEALKSYFTASKIAMDEGNNRDLGLTYITIADVYSVMENHSNAISYYRSAIEVLEKENDSVNLASALSNAGDEYFNQRKLDSAMIFLNKAKSIFEALNHEQGVAYALGNIGMVYAEDGRDVEAAENLNKAIGILEKTKDYYPISVYLTFMSDIYKRHNDKERALLYAQRSLQLAEQYGLKDQIGESNLKLSQLYEDANDPWRSLAYFKKYKAFSDSIKNLSSVQEMANLRTDFEISKKQIEVDLLKKESEIQILQEKRQRLIIYVSIIAAVLLFLLLMGIYKRYKFIERTKLLIEKEQQRSELLLRNILPEETAAELKEFGKVKAQRFESVTVMFTDFKNFTSHSENLGPEELVKSVDLYFSRFDEIIDKYGLEKIKTIGDCYMCAGGLPFPTEDHAHRMIEAAMEINDFIEKMKNENGHSHMSFDARIGINSGPVVAGVVGTKKFAYDIWGDTVNIASRMETNSDSGKINISENTYKLINGSFNCEYRGEIFVKNKGMMKMYFVNGKSLS